MEPTTIASDVPLGFEETILPSQYFGALRSVVLGGEQRLMLAVLVDALNVLQNWQRVSTVRKRRAFTEAAQWVNMRGTRYAFSFDSICDALGIDAQALRRRLSSVTMGHTRTAPRLNMGRLRLSDSGRATHATANRQHRRPSNRGAIRSLLPTITSIANEMRSHAVKPKHLNEQGVMK